MNLLKLHVENPTSLGHGVWLATVSKGELAYLQGKRIKKGERSIVALWGAMDPDSKNLEFELSQAEVLVEGSGGETVFIGNPQVREEPKEEFARAGVTTPATSGPTFPEPAAKIDSELARGEVLPAFSVFWVTVGVGRQGNFLRAIQSGVWGVPEGSENRLNDVQVGDLILFYGKDIHFALCRVTRRRFFSQDRVWDDGIYPGRVGIELLMENHHAGFPDAWEHLRDVYGNRYRNNLAAACSIRGSSGTFRRLGPSEYRGLFTALGWQRFLTPHQEMPAE